MPFLVIHPSNKITRFSYCSLIGLSVSPALGRSLSNCSLILCIRLLTNTIDFTKHSNHTYKKHNKKKLTILLPLCAVHVDFKLVQSIIAD